jgi:RNA polymerase sigma-70 factor (ECF subfamily)
MFGVQHGERCLAEQSGTVAGDLDQFLAEHERRAFRMAMIATGEKADALDIVQDAMLKLVRSYAHKPKTEWPALFHRIVQNAINDWFRKEKVRKTWRQWFSWGRDDDDAGVTEDPVSQVEQMGTHRPDEVLIQQNAMQRLDELLNELPLRQQQVFLLRQWEGLDVAETAKAMGISEGSVKTHYSRAVHSLRAQLEEHV